MWFLRYEESTGIENEIVKKAFAVADLKTAEEKHKALKQMISEMICNVTPEQAQELLNNVDEIYHKKAPNFCKIVIMIEMNVIAWKDEERLEILRWYCDELADKLKESKDHRTMIRQCMQSEYTF